MHDTKLLIGNEPESAAPSSNVAPSRAHVPARSNFWAIVGLCVVGLVCSLFVPASYLHMEQTSTLLLQEPLS